MTELFATTQDALVFAFNYSSQQYPRTPMSQIVKGRDVGTGKGLVSTAGAAQAGMIQAVLNGMDPIKRACVIARLAPKTGKCSCCGGDVLDKRWKAAIDDLAEWALQFTSGVISKRSVREAIILNFFSKGVSIQVAAKEADVPTKTAYTQRATIHAALRDVDGQAQSEIADMLEATRVIAGVAADVL